MCFACLCENIANRTPQNVQNEPATDRSTANDTPHDVTLQFLRFEAQISVYNIVPSVGEGLTYALQNLPRTVKDLIITLATLRLLSLVTKTAMLAYFMFPALRVLPHMARQVTSTC